MTDQTMDRRTTRQPAGIAGFTRALGNCAVVLTAESIRAAGELATDVVVAVAEPCDRILGTDREGGALRRTRERQSRYTLSGSVERAVDRATEAVERSRDAFVEGLDQQAEIEREEASEEAQAARSRESAASAPKRRGGTSESSA